MAFDISSIFGDCAHLGTTREQIEYLPLDVIDPDPANFYSLDGIEELAGNIELVGLLQPLRVRDAEGGHVTITAGHRRRAAIQLIVDGGSDQFAEGVPLIREAAAESPELQELRLIYANASTRVMAPAELARQAERVETLLYSLKEQGVEFPGRMRDHVAQACQVSKSKLARVKFIRERLVNDLLVRAWEQGQLSEAAASILACSAPGNQSNIVARYGVDSLAAMSVADLDKAITRVEHDTAKPIDFKALDNAVAAAKGQRPGEDIAADYLAEREAEDKLFRLRLKKLADNFISELGHCHSRQEGIDRLKKSLGLRHSSAYCGKGGYASLPKGLIVGDFTRNPITRTWTEVYDTLALIAIDQYGKGSCAQMGTDEGDDDGES